MEYGLKTEGLAIGEMVVCMTGEWDDGRMV